MIVVNDEIVLRAPCQDVLPGEIDNLISLLEAELNYANRLGKSGIGLAAPQIGIAKKIAIVRLGNEASLNLVNAKLEKGFDSTVFTQEGCLSFPGRVEDTVRFQEVYITNNLVRPHSFVATGMLAVVCQHELDHLNSTLFMDRKLVKVVSPISKKKPGPNEPCLCGSNKKYKKCCGK